MNFHEIDGYWVHLYRKGGRHTEIRRHSFKNVETKNGGKNMTKCKQIDL